MRNSTKILTQFLGVSTLAYFINICPSHAAVMWSEITESPKGGFLLVPNPKKDSERIDLPVIDSIVPKPTDENKVISRTISVNTVFSAINTETRDLDKALPLITSIGLANVQSKISNINAGLSLLDSVVKVAGSIVKNDNEDAVNAINFNAVVSSDDQSITGINLIFSGLALVEIENGFFVDGGSFAEIGVSNVSFNGELIPIEWTIKSTETEPQTAEQRIRVPVPKSKNTKSLIYQISGLGQHTLKTPIPPSTEQDPTNGVLTIGTLSINASENRASGRGDVLAAIALTNWNATVQTECVVNNPAPSPGGLKRQAASVSLISSDVSPISSDCYDFGDAPNAFYKTVLASDGPRYQEGELQRLGREWDRETDGQPTPRADGDDRGPGCSCTELPNIDDEDGVIFGNNWVDVLFRLNRPPTDVYNLSAWWDINRNFEFDHPTERRIFDNFTIADLIPVDLSQNLYKKRYSNLGFDPKDYYSRFRLTWEPTEDVKPWGEVLSSDGISHGEVEDYPPRIPESSSTLSLLVFGLLGMGSKLINWYCRR